jgi:hypothetical protein
MLQTTTTTTMPSPLRNSAMKIKASEDTNVEVCK